MPQPDLATTLILAMQGGNQAPEEVGFLERIAAEPALVQLFLVVVGFVLLWLVFGRLARRVKEAEARAAIRDYLLAMEQTLSGDLKGAASRLQRVLKEDPENTHARYLYGLVLSDLGDPAEAHKQHLQLQRGMGMESPRNDKALAKNLLAVGHADDAVEPAARAAQKLPEDGEALRLLFRAQLAAGYPEEAGGTGRRLAHMLPAGEEQKRVLNESSEAYALAAKRTRASRPVFFRFCRSPARPLLRKSWPSSCPRSPIAARSVFANSRDLCRSVRTVALRARSMRWNLCSFVKSPHPEGSWTRWKKTAPTWRACSSRSPKAIEMLRKS
ncbi:MAG: tetratricopeptide repeat protein [Planctomycetota bacterium]|jgi:tetratricopeptide (TPR) repeat protein